MQSLYIIIFIIIKHAKSENANAFYVLMILVWFTMVFVKCHLLIIVL